MKKINLLISLLVISFIIGSCGKDDAVVTPPVQDEYFLKMDSVVVRGNADKTIRATYKGAKRNKITVTFTGETDAPPNNYFQVLCEASRDTTEQLVTTQYFNTNDPVVLNRDHSFVVEVGQYENLGLIFTLKLIRPPSTGIFVKLKNIRVKES